MKISQLVQSQVVTSTTAATVTADYTVPQGNVLELRNVSANGAAGAAQNVTRRGIKIVSPNGTVDIAQSETDGAVADRVFLNWSGKIYVQPGATIRADFSFNAGANANDVVLNFHGILYRTDGETF